MFDKALNTAMYSKSKKHPKNKVKTNFYTSYIIVLKTVEKPLKNPYNGVK